MPCRSIRLSYLQNDYFGGFYVLEKPPALHWYYARAVASSLFSRYRHVSQYTWVDYSAADGRKVEVRTDDGDESGACRIG